MTTALITGGLGNQLFQLASGLFVANGATLSLDFTSRDLRKNASGSPEILDFALPKNVAWDETLKANTSTQIMQNILFRSALGKKNYLEAIAISYLKYATNSKELDFFVNFGVGYDERINYLKYESYLLGYFQNYITPSQAKVLRDLKSLKPIYMTEPLIAKVNEALNVKPLIVHVRLTDYKNERNIGVLKKNYYSKACESAFEVCNFSEIWLFSDEPREAVEFVPRKFRHLVRQNLDENLSSVQTLHLMRQGFGFVIANSTFSWWSAFLRADPDAQVFAPRPWFATKQTPKDLIPLEWHPIEY
jgi:hypothetical protein